MTLSQKPIERTHPTNNPRTGYIAFAMLNGRLCQFISQSSLEMRKRSKIIKAIAYAVLLIVHLRAIATHSTRLNLRDRSPVVANPFIGHSILIPILLEVLLPDKVEQS